MKKLTEKILSKKTLKQLKKGYGVISPEDRFKIRHDLCQDLNEIRKDIEQFRITKRVFPQLINGELRSLDKRIKIMKTNIKLMLQVLLEA